MIESYKTQPITREERKAIAAVHAAGAPFKVPDTHIRRRLKDLDDWRYIFDTEAREYVEDMHRRDDPGGRPALSIARDAGFQTVDDLLQDRKRKVMLKYYGREGLREADIPWRPLSEEPRGQRAPGRAALEAFMASSTGEQMERFFNMIMELRDWDSKTRWSTQPRGIDVTANADGTRSAEF
jgi:hypothetical protein